MKKTWIFTALALSSLNALEFEEIGHKSTGMGGVGVAMRDNPYGLFYNPALLSTNTDTKIGYGIGGEYNERALLDVFDYDLNDISNVDAFNSILNNNSIRAKVKGAFAFQIPDILYVGNLSIGYMRSAQISAAFNGYLSSTSIDDSDIGFKVRYLDATEIPIAYAVPIETDFGEVHLGAALKFMSYSNARIDNTLTAEDSRGGIESDIRGILNGSFASTKNNVGLDLGLAYVPFDELMVGVSAKNINVPTFRFSNGKLTVYPQIRAGIEWSINDFMTLETDMDLTKNPVLVPVNSPKQYSQKIGLGVNIDTWLLDARAGIAKDLRQDNGAILSIGAGFGFLDFALAVSTSSGYQNIPRYVAVQVGGGFSF